MSAIFVEVGDEMFPKPYTFNSNEKMRFK